TGGLTGVPGAPRSRPVPSSGAAHSPAGPSCVWSTTEPAASLDRGRGEDRKVPRLCANLSMMFNEVPFLERFEQSAKAGFEAVEFRFPYDYPAAELRKRLDGSGLKQILFNGPPGDWSAGERGIACLPGRVQDFRDGLRRALDYATALD